MVKLYGGNPEVEFIGNPYSLNAYGVYEKPIANVASQYKSGIKIATGTSFEKNTRSSKNRQTSYGMDLHVTSSPIYITVLDI